MLHKLSNKCLSEESKGLRSRSDILVAAGHLFSTPTYPILLVPCQMARQDVWTRRGEVSIGTYSPCRFDQQGANKIGSVSWPESGPSWLLLLAVEKK